MVSGLGCYMHFRPGSGFIRAPPHVMSRSTGRTYSVRDNAERLGEKIFKKVEVRGLQGLG